MSRDSETVSLKICVAFIAKTHLHRTSTQRKALWHKKDTDIEKYKALPGSPDIVLTKYKIAIFATVNFFHGKDWGNLKAPS